MTGDPQYSNMSLISTFLKAFNRAYLGPLPTEGESGALPDGVQELIPPEVQKKMRELFVNYFETASKTLVKGQMVCGRIHCLADDRNFSSRTSVTMRRISSLVKCSRTARTRMSA